MTLAFVVPIASRRYVRDFDAVSSRLGVTLSALKRQQNNDYKVLVVGNDRPDLSRNMLRDIIFVETALEIDNPARRGRREIDKQRKLYCGFVALKGISPSFVMPLDYDDLVDVRLVEYVHRNAGKFDAFILNRGYIYTDGEEYCRYSHRIYQRTGSNIVVRYNPAWFPTVFSTFDPPPESYLDWPFVESHVKDPFTLFRGLEARVARIPFPSVVWRRNADSVSNAYSQADEIVGNVESRKKRLMSFIKNRILSRRIDPAISLYFGCDIGTRLGTVSTTASCQTVPCQSES